MSSAEMCLLHRACQSCSEDGVSWPLGPQPGGSSFKCIMLLPTFLLFPPHIPFRLAPAFFPRLSVCNLAYLWKRWGLGGDWSRMW